MFLGFALLTLALTAFVGRPPSELGSAVALPHRLIFRMSHNVRQIISSMTDRRELRSEVARLERELAELRSNQRQLELQLERYVQATRIQELQSPGVVATAPVTGVDASSVLSRIRLGAGHSQGVRENMPVTVPEGLVGVVSEVTERSANVRAITDPMSRVGVTVQGRGGQGTARGEPGGVLLIYNYAESDPVQVGDQVETSSRGGLFPRGILVGEVIEVLPKDPNSLRIEFLVQPSVDLPNLLEVALIEPL